ncbi:MAG: gliding motility-associated C-terminal domain-containing protein [Sphingobacteriales bacterium JAD_PAG50586_3]|nr:MAG: gliding motility-associated C-terminal domain-containing protein [Sphingobacteriales bacterium JAD_PAG50586_3]
MTVGNFKGNQNTNLLNLGPSLINYYYFDSFSLVECNPPPPSIEIIIPNIFTPNKDGINDNFNIENLPDNSLLTVYNRWGASVYQSNNYNNDWTGESLSDGVYYYILTLPSGNSTKGTVTILRD